MMGQADCECSERDGSPTVRRRFEAEAGWVADGNDCERSAAVGEINATNTSLVLDQDAKEILVGDLLAMASRLDSSHHELILWRERLHNTLLLLLCSNIVFDLIKFEAHVGGPVGYASHGTLNLLIDKSCGVSMAVVANLNTQDLFNVEAYPISIQ